MYGYGDFGYPYTAYPLACGYRPYYGGYGLGLVVVLLILLLVLGGFFYYRYYY
ncbi:hypothetical protein [Pontibacillus yanchengensis]|uniref:hypothetical protein n=1 Tax=Pontibacillus yanchengensis TaxID=462910 RepID=UPI000A42130E|nr:hypothetical protein [Pontibacillus yanchengensis]